MIRSEPSANIWYNVPPIAKLDASVLTPNGSDESAIDRTGVDDMATLSFSKLLR